MNRSSDWAWAFQTLSRIHTKASDSSFPSQNITLQRDAAVVGKTTLCWLEFKYHGNPEAQDLCHLTVLSGWVFFFSTMWQQIIFFVYLHLSKRSTIDWSVVNYPADCMQNADNKPDFSFFSFFFFNLPVAINLLDLGIIITYRFFCLIESHTYFPYFSFPAVAPNKWSSVCGGHIEGKPFSFFFIVLYLCFTRDFHSDYMQNTYYMYLKPKLCALKSCANSVSEVFTVTVKFKIHMLVKNIVFS